MWPLRTYFSEFWTKREHLLFITCIWKCRLQNGGQLCVNMDQTNECKTKQYACFMEYVKHTVHISLRTKCHWIWVLMRSVCHKCSLQKLLPGSSWIVESSKCKCPPRQWCYSGGLRLKPFDRLVFGKGNTRWSPFAVTISKISFWKDVCVYYFKGLNYNKALMVMVMSVRRTWGKPLHEPMKS